MIQLFEGLVFSPVYLNAWFYLPAQLKRQLQNTHSFKQKYIISYAYQIDPIGKAYFLPFFSVSLSLFLPSSPQLPSSLSLSLSFSSFCIQFFFKSMTGSLKTIWKIRKSTKNLSIISPPGENSWYICCQSLFSVNLHLHMHHPSLTLN